MVKIEELVGKTDAELKLFLKEVMFDQTKEFDWIDFFKKYVKFGSNSVGSLTNKINNSFEGNDLEQILYFIRNIEILEYDKKIMTDNDTFQSLNINILNNKLNLNVKYLFDFYSSTEQYNLNISTYEKEKITEFLEFIFTNMKEIIKSISKSNLNEITDFFGDITLDKNNRKYDLEIKNDLL